MRAVIRCVVKPPSRRVVVTVVLLGALLLRVAGLDFGLPLAEARPDEQTIAYQAMKFGRGDLNPHSFNYPSLFKYVCFGLFGADYAVGRALGRFAGQDDFLRAFFAADPEFRLLMRAWSATLGTVGVALLLRGPGGLFAATLLAVNFLHVRDSHFGVTDITMTTLVTAGALLAERYAREGGLRRAMAAGLVAGLATSTKYNAAVLALPLVLAAGYAPVPIGMPATKARSVGVLTAGGSMIAGFVAGTPFALIEPGTFLRDFRYELSHLESGQFVDVGPAWLSHATRTLPDAMGVIGLLAGVVGIGWAFRRHGLRAGVLYAFPIAYFLLIGRGKLAFYRYMLPVLPFLCMGAGSAIRRLAKRTDGRGAWLNLAICAALPLLASLQADRLFLRDDTREQMGRWIEANVPTDAVIVHAGAYTGAPMLQRNVANNQREAAARAGRADSAGFRRADDLKWYRQYRPMYDVVLVSKEGVDHASQRSVAELLIDPPEWLEVEDYPLSHYASVPSEITALAERDFDLVYEASAGTDIGDRGARWDQQDAFYMPVHRLSAVERMGPTLRLYRRKAALSVPASIDEILTAPPGHLGPGGEPSPQPDAPAD